MNRHGGDWNLEKSHQRAHYHSGHNPDTSPFAYSLSNKYERCSGDRNTVETSRTNVLEPKIIVKGMCNVQQTGIRYKRSTNECCHSRTLAPEHPSERVASQSDKERSERRPEAYHGLISRLVSYFG